MLKHIIIIVVLSIIVILAMPYAQQAVLALIAAHDWLANLLKDVFSVGQAGNIIRQLLALLVIPVVVSAVPAVLYWLIKRQWLLFFMEMIWVIWLIQTSALVVLHKAGT